MIWSGLQLLWELDFILLTKVYYFWDSSQSLTELPTLYLPSWVTLNFNLYSPVPWFRWVLPCISAVHQNHQIPYRGKEVWNFGLTSLSFSLFLFYLYIFFTDLANVSLILISVQVNYSSSRRELFQNTNLSYQNIATLNSY